MADQHSDEGVSTRGVSAEISESMVELNIKTLDSQLYSFHVDKNMPVSMFKEKIASEIGLPVGQQRLIFRGKVLKDDHLLSEYHVESGHTLHLVARQPSQPQPSSGSGAEETTANSNNAGQDASAAGSRPRIGQVTHSVVLGTFGVGDQNEGGVPDISRVIGAVLNSLGIGGQTAMGGIGGSQPNMQFNTPVHASQGNEAEGSPANSSNSSQAGNQSHPRNLSQSMPQVLQIPLGAAIAVPSLSVPIPDSLNTLSEFMNCMELALSQDGGYQPNHPVHSTEGSPAVELPSNARGLPTPAALAVVLRHAERLLSGPAIVSLSHIAGRLEQEEGSTDLTVRTQIQTEAMQAGLAMQHLGALLLELGRTTLTLRIGQSPAESSVNAGPSVYISPSGPNPIMVQPFPLQTNSLFGGPAAPPLNLGSFGPVGVGAVPRHVNIHIHAGIGQRATNGEANQVERANGAGNATASAIPSRPAAVSVSSTAQPTNTVSQPSADSASLSTIISGINSQLRNIVDNMQSQPESSAGHNQSLASDAGNDESHNCLGHSASDGVREDTRGGMDKKDATSSSTAKSTECSSSGKTTLKSVSDADAAPSSSPQAGSSESTSATPLGLGLGGLQPKRRTRQPRSQMSISDRLSSIARRGQSPAAVPGVMESMPSGGNDAGGQLDPASIMSQVIQNPALDGLLAGVSQQTGIGSPDVLRNMLGQLTQNPAMMNTVNQLAQQIDNQDLGSVFSGLGGAEGGGIDLSRMMQQMMPFVSRALSDSSNVRQQVPAVEHEKSNDQHSQINLQDVAQRIVDQDPPREVFSSVVDSAVHLCNNGNGTGDLAEELCSDEGLVNEFMEILRRDVSKRLQDESGTAGKS